MAQADWRKKKSVIISVESKDKKCICIDVLLVIACPFDTERSPL
jgi:hypothetical protein